MFHHSFHSVSRTKTVLALATCAALTVVAFPTFAADEVGASESQKELAPTTGVELGLRVGYALPVGKANGYERDSAMTSMVKGQVPLRVDVGYRIDPHVYVGAYAQYGFASMSQEVAQQCDGCSMSTLGLGIMAAYHFRPAASFDPWVGLGTGIESLKLSTPGTRHTTLNGVTFADVQLGGDFRPSRSMMLGPFVDFALGRYSSGTDETGTSDIEQKGVHAWIGVGLRGAYGLW